jgi:5-bromo-4-chloroindolyl phosphate hydrolysis protein
MKFLLIILSIGFFGFMSVSAASETEQKRNARLYSPKSLMKKREVLTRILSKISSKEDKNFLYSLWAGWLYDDRGIADFLFKNGELSRRSYQAYLKKNAREYHIAAKALKKMGFEEESQHFKERGGIVTETKRIYNSSREGRGGRKKTSYRY